MPHALRLRGSGPLLAALLCLAAAPTTAAEQRVIVLGFDGVDPQTTQQLMDAGRLPHLSRLAAEGSFRELATSNPAESPVSWASFSMSRGPGHHGIFDFVHRRIGSYIPEIALARESTQPIFPNKALRGAVVLGLALVLALIAFGIARALRAALLSASVLAGLVLLIASAGAAIALFRWLPYEVPVALATRQGVPWWDTLAAAGHRVTAIDMPVCFPADAEPGVQLTSGLGTPDVRKTWGNWTIYSDETFSKSSTETAGNLRHVAMSGSQGIGALRGPENFLLKARKDLSLQQREADLPIEFERLGDDRMRITVQKQSIELKLGEWSDWVVLEFRFNPLVKLVGMTRFKLTALQPYFRVYQEPLNFHPEHLPPTVNISSPREYAADLAAEYGLRETIGWAIATNPLKDEQIDYDTFLEDLKFTLANRERVVRGELAKDDWDVFVGVFLSTDRMQHMMYRFWDESHPNYDAELAAKYRDQIPWVYEQMDRIVGDILRDFVDDQTHLMIISDHGFHSFRRGVNLNTWLVRNGYMTLKGMDAGANYQNLEDFFDPEGRFFKNVDWAKTRAYCLGLGAVYINLRGRESQGIVNPSEYEPLKDELIAAMMNMEDPAFPGQAVVHAVYRREDVFQGPQLPLAPDLFVGFESGWRVSWQTGAGGIPPDTFEDNLNNWSGDHCSVAPGLTAGIFFSNRPIVEANPSIMDIGATVLSSYGVAVPKDYEGKPLTLQPGG